MRDEHELGLQREVGGGGGWGGREGGEGGQGGVRVRVWGFRV